MPRTVRTRTWEHTLGISLWLDSVSRLFVLSCKAPTCVMGGHGVVPRSLVCAWHALWGVGLSWFGMPTVGRAWKAASTTAYGIPPPEHPRVGGHACRVELLHLMIHHGVRAAPLEQLQLVQHVASLYIRSCCQVHAYVSLVFPSLASYDPLLLTCGNHCRQSRQLFPSTLGEHQLDQLLFWDAWFMPSPWPGSAAVAVTGTVAHGRASPAATAHIGWLPGQPQLGKACAKNFASFAKVSSDVAIPGQGSS